MHKYESNAQFDRIYCSENTLLLLLKMYLWGLHMYFERTGIFCESLCQKKQKFLETVEDDNRRYK